MVVERDVPDLVVLADRHGEAAAGAIAKAVPQGRLDAGKAVIEIGVGGGAEAGEQLVEEVVVVAR